MAAAAEINVRLSRNRQYERTEFERVEEVDFSIVLKAP
jgi:hypothetical protein